MIDYTNLDSHTESELIEWLTHHDSLYENTGECGVSDSVYDNVRRYAELSYPANLYFTGVGSDVRGGKVVLPYMMSGLTQVYEGQVDTMLFNEMADQVFVVSDKLDGTSAQLIYNADGELQIAFSRGNGTEGADITRHIKLIESIPKQLKKAPGRTLPVRMEIIIPKSNWETVKTNFPRRTGEEYVNSRNATAGIMNASANDPKIYQYMRGVAYTIIENSSLTKLEQLEELEQYGFECVRYQHNIGSQYSEAMLVKILNNTRQTSQYELDGVVIDLNDKKIDTKGQPSVVKFKVADVSNYAEAIVKDVIFTPSKDGYLKPRVEIVPITLCGVTITYATGFNANFIYENKIGPGAVIAIQRAGDVIPFIMKVLKPSNV